jgi:hypothetical protein
MNTIPTPGEHDIQAALGQLSRDDMQALMQHMVQLHPDLAGLIVSKQPTATRKPRAPLNPELYRLQVEKIFYTTDRNTWGSEARAAEPLLDMVDIADDYVQQMDFTDAAVLYEIVIRGILDNYDSFRWHADEGQLDEVVEDCVEGLSNSLRGVQADTAVRRQILRTLFDVYDFDTSLENDMPVMSAKVPAILVRYTTPEERRMIAAWVRETFDLDIDWHADNGSEDYEDIDVLLLGLEGDTIDDETFLRISHEMESYHHVVDRLLKLGRLDDALAEAKHVENYDILAITDILCEHGHEAAAERLIEERVKEYDDTHLLQWLQERYQARGNVADALKMASRIFRAHPLAATIERYREIRRLAQQLGRWETVQSEVMADVKQSRDTALQIKIALDEGQVELALSLLVAQKQTENSHSGPYGADNFNVGIEVAKAVEESHPQEAIEIYQAYVETRIEWRGRENYQIACQYLTSIRRLYQKLGKSDVWNRYIATLREQHRNLPALKDELAKAKL